MQKLYSRSDSNNFIIFIYLSEPFGVWTNCYLHYNYCFLSTIIISNSNLLIFLNMFILHYVKYFASLTIHNMFLYRSINHQALKYVSY